MGANAIKDISERMVKAGSELHAQGLVRGCLLYTSDAADE